MTLRQKYINSIPATRVKRPLEKLFGLNEATQVPATGTKGYPVGTTFTLLNPTAGQSLNWINIGDEFSALFVPTGLTYGYGFFAAGAKAATNGSTTESVGTGLLDNSDIVLAGHIASDDDDYIASVTVTDDDGEAVITASADPLNAHGYLWAALRSYCVPTWDIVFAGTAVSTAAATTAITVTGVLATDIALACYQVTDDTDAIEKTVCTADTVTVSHSATSSTGHTIGYVVLRARGTFKPSHYVFAAASGVATTADASGIATNDITVTGALTTDIAFAVIETQGGTIEIARAQISAASTLTIQFSADPSTTSAVTYMVIRAY